MPRDHARGRKPGLRLRGAGAPQPRPAPLDLEQARAVLAAALSAAAGVAARLDTNAIRLLHGSAGGIPGLVIEQLADVLVVQLHIGILALSEEQVRELLEQARQAVGARAVYRKWFPRDRSAALPRLEAAHRDPTPWIGQPVEPEITVRESGLHFLVRPYNGYSTGLFLDHRNHRRLVRDAARGKRVLNLCSYTCASSVAAAAGGAVRTTSVDVSPRYLEWGRRNFAANGLDPARHAFIRSDVFEYLRSAGRSKERFDLVLLDPPALGRDKASGRTLCLADDLDALLERAIGLVAPGGVLLFSTNLRSLRTQRIRDALRRAAGGRVLHRLDPIALPIDFSGDRDYQRSFLVRLG